MDGAKLVLVTRILHASAIPTVINGVKLVLREVCMGCWRLRCEVAYSKEAEQVLAPVLKGVWCVFWVLDSKHGWGPALLFAI